MRLAGKVALITGGGSGIGRACALEFAREGAKVALVGRTRAKLEQVAGEIGEAAFVSAAEISKSADVERTVTATIARFGELDIVVNSAATLIAGTATSHTEAEWDATFGANVKGVWLLSRESLPYLRAAGGGAIINISSAIGLVGARNRLAYSASKGAITLLTKSMALDHAHENIRVNCICPGIVETELVSEFITKAPDPEAARKQRIGLHPLGRFGKPVDIAHAAVYLASDEAAWVTGAAFSIDGGFTAV
jgi:NAD(P)-dependent dehydrogenase (short-subunit alcohol dehydrogenase family)